MDKNVKTYLIPNDLCKRAGLASAWLPMNELSVFPYAKRNFRQADVPSHFSSSESVSLFHLRQEVILFHPILRKLVNESNGVFLAVQNLSKNKTADHKAELFKLSIQYRSIIRACLENFQDEIPKCQKEEQEELQSYITIFYSIECIWHLCEILFINGIPGNHVLPHLLEWIRFHFPKRERNAAQLLSGDLVGLEAQPEYWNTVIGSLLQGRVKVVRALLRQHSAADSTTYKLVDQVLKAIPVYNGIGGSSLSEYSIQWKHWMLDVQSKVDAKLFASEEKLDLMMRLVVGIYHSMLKFLTDKIFFLF